MKKNAFLLIVISFLNSYAHGANFYYPDSDISFLPTGNPMLKITKPVSVDNKSKWNTVFFRAPSPFAYDPDLSFSGSVKVESKIPPRHIGINIKTSSGKVGYASARPGETFSIPFSKFTIVPAESKSSEPFSPSDSIIEIRVYASFPEETQSTFILSDFAVEKLPTAKAGGLAIPQANQYLLQGEFDIRKEWRGVHPRLYASKNDLMEASALYRKKPDFFKQYLPLPKDLTAAMVPLDSEISAQGTSMVIAKLAVAYRITGEPQYLERLRQWIPVLNAYQPPVMDSIGSNRGLTGGHIMLGFSIAYDVLKGIADSDLEDAVKGVLVRESRQMFHDISKLHNYPFEQNHLIIPVCGLAVSALTLCDESPESKIWGVLASNIMERSLDCIAYDGWFFEGISYWNYTIQYPAAYAAAMQRLVGGNLFLKPPFKDAPLYLAHMTLPNKDFVFDFADWGPRTERDGIRFQKGYELPWHTLTTRVKFFVPYLIWKEGGKNPFLMDYIQKIVPSDFQSTGIYTIDGIFGMLLQISLDEAPKNSPHYADYPPYHYFKDMEVVHWRNDWNDPDATAIAFKSGPPAGHRFIEHLKRNPSSKPSLGHAHPDAGSFLIYSHGAFLANDTGYTGKKETADHNSILVDGIGQNNGGTPWGTFTDKPYSEYDKIRMENVWLGPSVMASTAVFQDAYRNDLKMKKVLRHLLMLDGRFLIIKDMIESEIPHSYTWLLHTDAKPNSPSANNYTMVNGKAQITILPLSPGVKAEVAPTVVETELYDMKRQRPQQRGFHLSFSSPRQTSYEFLNALLIDEAKKNGSKFSASKGTDGDITLSDGETSCTAWIGNGNNLKGNFAYTATDAAGKIVSAGLSGTSLKTKDFSIDLNVEGSATFKISADGTWKLESSSSIYPKCEAAIKNKDGKIQKFILQSQGK